MQPSRFCGPARPKGVRIPLGIRTRCKLYDPESMEIWRELMRLISETQDAPGLDEEGLVA